MQKGFTLVELLIVIAILAVLSVTVVVVLNPAELLKQARDSTRISDLASVNSAIALYLTDVATPGIGGAANAACSSPMSRVTAASGTNPFVFAANPTTNTTTTPDGTGWVAVALQNITGGSPLSRLPLDPVNAAPYLYGYACGTNPSGNAALSYELDTLLESSKYAGYMAATKDGGNNANAYEVGSYLSQ